MDVIVYKERVLVDSPDADIHPIARRVVSEEMSTADHGYAGDTITYGNATGRTLLADNDDQKKKKRPIGGTDIENCGRHSGSTESLRGSTGPNQGSTDPNQRSTETN